MILSIFYNGGKMMNEAQITVGELSSFMLYAAFVGVSVSGKLSHLLLVVINCNSLVLQLIFHLSQGH